MDQELLQYLDGRFGQIEQRLDAHDQRFDRIEQRLGAHNRRFDLLDRKIDEKVEDVKRHTGVLVEGLRHELTVVAEGLAMHIQVQHTQEREYHDQQHRETRALLRSFYDELRQQQDQIRHRVDGLERKQEN